ncbi:MAG: alkaline phosphatase family protein [Bacteroidota bacterium]
MKRRSFLKKAGLTAGASLAAPYILPTGRLFARTMNRKVNHVVVVLFAGGIRNIEAIQQAEGNLMQASFAGAASTIPGLDPIPQSPHSSLLANEGTLFPEFRYAEGPTGHFNGHTVALTGVYSNTGLNLKAHPEAPTLFEYYMKHNSPSVSARNAWWVSNSLGPYPALNYSQHPSYGPLYGANHIVPTSLAGSFQVLQEPKQFQFHEEEKIAGIRNFLNQNFDKSALSSGDSNYNTPDDAKAIQAFIKQLIDLGSAGGYNNPLGMPTQYATNDVYTILMAEEILKEFEPELLVVNMTDVDACHQNFTAYCNNLQKADYAVAHLWNMIQNTPGLANDTAMIMVPEHGRNLLPNTIMDVYGRAGIDHTGDPTSREIFSMILGPDSVIKQGQTVGTPSVPIGESIDIVPTVAHLLGFDSQIPGGLLPGRVLTEAIV